MAYQHDLLSHHIATPTTPVPGQWLLELPFSPSYIHIRRYTYKHAIPEAESSSDAIRRAAVEALLGRGNEDPLDRAWRVVNGPNANEVDAGVKTVLRSACAIVVPSEGSGKERELWLFEIRGPNASEGDRYHHEVLEPLDLSETQMEPLNISQLLACERHGHSTSCLSLSDSIQSACEVMWDPGKWAMSWKLFTWAVLEKLAWRDGRRLCMVQTEGQESGMPAITLRPLTTQHLLLNLQSQRSQSKPSTSKLAEEETSTLLLPMRTPAIPLGEFQPSAEQLEYLDSSFTSALGTRWKANQYRGRILYPKRGSGDAEWAVYWVPITPAVADTKTDTALTSENGFNPNINEPVNQGVLVVWPNHLSLPLQAQQSPSFLRVKRKRPISTVYEFPEPTEIMNTATSFFDFMSTYKEPPPPVPEPEPIVEQEEVPIVDMPTPATGPTGTDSTPKIPFEVDPPLGSGTNDEEGDIDDLFSSNPTSPLAIQTQEPVEHGTIDDFDDLFGGGGEADAGEAVELDKDFEMDGPESQMGRKEGMGDEYGRYTGTGNGDAIVVGEDQGGIMVTEDDFDFFDSPAEREATGVDEPPLRDQARSVEVGVKLDDRGRGMKEVEVEQSASDSGGQELDDGPLNLDMEEVQPLINPDKSPSDSRPHIPSPSHPTEHNGPSDASFEQENDENSSSSLRSPPLNMPSSHPDADNTVILQKSLSHAERASPADPKSIVPYLLSPASPFDIIPSDFSPLPFIQVPSLPHPVYTMPTPASTPESLRVNLIERLRQSKKQKGDSDYTSAWNVDEEPSEAEEEYDDSGAPPTPVSEMITDDEEVQAQSGTTGKKEVGGNAVHWNGMPCLGAEWLWVNADETVSGLIRRQWNEEWKTADKETAQSILTSSPIPPETKVSLLDDNLDFNRLAIEMISNRYLREEVLSESITDLFTKQDMGYLDETGMPLSDILDPIEHAELDFAGSGIRELGSCNVHAGFAGNVMRLSIAGIQYWKQLGLSPVGGEKEVEAMVVTVPGYGMKRAGEVFLREMTKVWDELRLGTHSISIKTGEEGGIVQVDLSNLAVKIGELYRTAHPSQNLVIYLLYDAIDSLPPSMLQSLAQPTTETTILHMIPLSATQPRLLPDLAFDVYNRIPRLLHRIESRGIPLNGTPTYLQYPSFTLAPDQPIKPSLSLSWPSKSYDVLNRWRYLHAAYAYNPDSGLMATFIIDAEGENYDVRTYRTKGMDVRGRLELVWKAFTEFADLAAIEWRMSVTRVGRMEHAERQAWRAIIGAVAVTLLMVDTPSSASPTGPQIQTSAFPIPGPLFTDPTSRIVSDTLTARTASYTHRLPVVLADKGDETIHPLVSFIVNIQTIPTAHDRLLTKACTATFHVLAHRAAPGKELEKVDEVLSREFQRLEYLGRLRFGFEGGAVGAHVTAADSVLRGLLCLGRKSSGAL